MKFVIKNTTEENENTNREKLKELLVNRQINFKNIKSSRELVPYNRLMEMLDFYNRKEFCLVQNLKIKYEIIEFDIKPHS